jgi:hypothetical protein
VLVSVAPHGSGHGDKVFGALHTKVCTAPDDRVFIVETKPDIFMTDKEGY